MAIFMAWFYPPALLSWFGAVRLCGAPFLLTGQRGNIDFKHVGLALYRSFTPILAKIRQELWLAALLAFATAIGRLPVYIAHGNGIVPVGAVAPVR